jgi:hypothetical protein
MCVLSLLSNKICSCRLTHFCSSYLPWYVEGNWGEEIEWRLAAFVLSRIDVNVFRFWFCFYCSVFSLSLYVCVSFKLSSYEVVMWWWHFLFSSSVYRLLLINFALHCHCHLLSLSLMFCSSSLVMRKRKSPSRRCDRGWLYVFALSLFRSQVYLPGMRVYVCTNKNE